MANMSGLIAVVDDNEAVRDSLPDLLGVYGLSACTFCSAEDFLSSDALLQIDCIILDVSMPGMSGPELLDELRARGLAMPVIFITALKDETIRDRMLERGAVDCLFKPFSNRSLLAALRSALRSC